MARETMRRQAADNEYLHKDFHGALSAGIEYLHRHYGAQAVKDYLRDFTLSYYAPLRQALKDRGLPAIEAHFRELYRIEGADAVIECTPDVLLVHVPACPAVRHLREQGYPVAALFVETTRTVNQALCEETPFTAELCAYDEETGRSVQCFYRKPS